MYTLFIALLYSLERMFSIHGQSRALSVFLVSPPRPEFNCSPVVPKVRVPKVDERSVFKSRGALHSFFSRFDN